MGEIIQVSLDTSLDLLGASPALLGTLNAEVTKGRLVTSFEFDNGWLRNGQNYFLDPDVSFFAGRQYPRHTNEMFGMFSDSCPDRWGKTLIQRQEAKEAREENRPPRTLTEIDYLLRVSDVGRMGALRYRREEDTPYLAESTAQSIPPMKRLRELEQSARILESDSGSSADADRELALLLMPGSSLGGARPKATVEDTEGNLWVAKFPSGNDTFDAGLAERLVYELARACGLRTVAAKSSQFSSAGHTFMAMRFDRVGQRRVHYASAMTLLGKRDGDGAQTGVSYLDIVEFIREQSASPESDLSELFTRIVFSLAVSNTDDHLRNHGFLLRQTGWELSPVFDVNPNPQGFGLSLNISEHDNSLSFELALEQATLFGLSKAEAEAIIKNVCSQVSRWEKRADSLGMCRPDKEYLRRAFKF